jgi:hypothetical protein
MNARLRRGSRSCRYGFPRVDEPTFVQQKEAHDVSDVRENHVGCRGCSLVLTRRHRWRYCRGRLRAGLSSQRVRTVPSKWSCRRCPGCAGRGCPSSGRLRRRLSLASALPSLRRSVKRQRTKSGFKRLGAPPCGGALFLTFESPCRDRAGRSADSNGPGDSFAPILSRPGGGELLGLWRVLHLHQLGDLFLGQRRR